MTKSKVTVVIPTRERPDTLAKCLKTVINQDYQNLDIIVSDNFSGPATAAVVQALNDPRVKYFNTGKRISMSHNFEFALSKIDDGWIVVLGDDDGLLPNSLGRVVNLLERSGLQALASYTCSYNWPSRNGSSESILTVPIRQGERLVSSKQALRRLMDWRMHSLILPQLYTGGVVSAALFKRICAIKGSFFQSQIPDVYSGIAICSVIDRYMLTHEPFAINGASRHSNGAALFRMEQTPFLNEGNIPFHPSIPLPETGTLTFSLPALVYESYLQSDYLHNDFLKVSPANQLELILNQTTMGRNVLVDWGKMFAAYHRIDHREILAKSKKTPIRRRISQLRAMLENLKDRYRIDTSYGMAINDVYEASIVAATVLNTRPGRLASYQSTFWRLMERVKNPQAPHTSSKMSQLDTEK